MENDVQSDWLDTLAKNLSRKREDIDDAIKNRDFLLKHLQTMLYVKFYASGSYRTGTQVLNPDEFDIHCIDPGLKVDVSRLDLSQPENRVNLVCLEISQNEFVAVKVNSFFGKTLNANDFQAKFFSVLRELSQNLTSIQSVKRKSSSIVVKVKRYGFVDYDIIPSLEIKGYQGCFLIPDGDLWKISYPQADANRICDMDRKFPQFKKVIRLLKYFRDQKRVKKLSSYTIGCFVHHFAQMGRWSIREGSTRGLFNTIYNILCDLHNAILLRHSVPHIYHGTDLLQKLTNDDRTKIQKSLVSIMYCISKCDESLLPGVK